jgi:hypothetical protein
MANGPILPRVHVMVLCDEVEAADDEDDVFTLWGVRSTIQTAAFPYIHPQLCIYLQVTGHPGVATLRAAAVLGRSDEAVFKFEERDVEFFGPLAVVPVYWGITDCGFPEAGVYYMQIYHGDKLLCERQLHLYEYEEPDHG